MDSIGGFRNQNNCSFQMSTFDNNSDLLADVRCFSSCLYGWNLDINVGMAFRNSHVGLHCEVFVEQPGQNRNVDVGF